MKPVELKVARIGNSRGVRLPAPTLERYRIGATVVMEERSDGILLRPPGSVSPNSPGRRPLREMAAAAEEWGAWDVSLADGLDEVPWEVAKSRVAERGPRNSPALPRKTVKRYDIRWASLDPVQGAEMAKTGRP